MKSIDTWFEEYGESHQNPINKKLHWICIPAIVFSLIGLLWSIPHGYFVGIFPGQYSPYLNWATIFMGLILLYYLRLSIPMAIGMLVFTLGVLYGNNYVIHNIQLPLWKFSIILFVIAWIGQFIGHKIEGKKPSFFQDLQFLLIGPAWLMGFIFRKLRIKY